MLSDFFMKINYFCNSNISTWLPPPRPSLPWDVTAKYLFSLDTAKPTGKEATLCFSRTFMLWVSIIANSDVLFNVANKYFSSLDNAIVLTPEFNFKLFQSFNVI